MNWFCMPYFNPTINFNMLQYISSDASQASKSQKVSNYQQIKKPYYLSKIKVYYAYHFVSQLATCIATCSLCMITIYSTELGFCFLEILNAILIINNNELHTITALGSRYYTLDQLINLSCISTCIIIQNLIYITD